MAPITQEKSMREGVKSLFDTTDIYMISISDNALVIYHLKLYRHCSLSHSLRNATFPPDTENYIQLMLNYGLWLEITH